MANAYPNEIVGSYRLTLGALGATYPDLWPADENDWLDEAGEDHIDDAHKLEELGYENHAYGRYSIDLGGHVWLQYWYWYYYNAKSVKGIGSHEGDWESVLIRLDEKSKPDLYVLSEHAGAARCEPEDVEVSEGGRPSVYIGLDSHAIYAAPGLYVLAVSPAEYDYADGVGTEAVPSLTVLSGAGPSWLGWPGHWGNSRAGSVVESSSPQGPAFHEAFEVPGSYAEAADECFAASILERGPRKATSRIRSVALAGRHPEIEYVVPDAAEKGTWPRLRITVQEAGGGPPTSKTFNEPATAKQVVLPVEVDPKKEAIVSGSVFYRDGRRVHLAPRILRPGA